jgi:hypothetical protein
MRERWLPVAGYDGYEVSDRGRVRSWRPLRNFAKPPTEPRLLKRARDKDGYWKVVLYRNKVSKDFRVATLVAEAWHGARPLGNVVRHLDGSKDNDTVENLAWGTPAQNSADSRVHGTWNHGRKVNTAKLSENDVGYVLTSASGNTELARELGVTPGAIWHIRAGRSWKHIQRPEGL